MMSLYLFIGLTSVIQHIKVHCEIPVDYPVFDLPFGGSLRGSTYEINTKYVHSFLGIPFAKPPVGRNRFLPPIPYGEWLEIRNATKLPNTCWHYQSSGFDLTNSAARIWVNNTEMDEDCLYLNVWTPVNQSVLTSSKLPVMIWIFGGGFFSGTATLEIYNGLYLAAYENVIIVSMQYRLGAFGFLYLGNQSRSAQGNMGLLDQQLAMKWVQDNIRSFGGDPDQVTLFGESAGAASVGLHFISPQGRSLFSRMIMQSASLFNRWALSTKEAARDRGMAFLKACNCTRYPDDPVEETECLRKLDPMTLVAQVDTVSSAINDRREKRLKEIRPPLAPNSNFKSSPFLTAVFRPVIDGMTVPHCPEDILRNMQRNRSLKKGPELIIGSMNNEGIYWILYGLGLSNINFLQPNGSVNLPTDELYQSLEVDLYRLIANKFTSDEHFVHPIPALIASEYRISSAELSNLIGYNPGVPVGEIFTFDTFLSKTDELLGDLEFVCGTMQFARAVSRISGSRVRYYNFIHKTKFNHLPDWVGAMHGYEIEYIFGMPFSTDFRKIFYNFTNDEEILSRKMMQFWTNFARTGNVNVNLDNSTQPIDWPEFNLDSELYIEIGSKLKVKQGFRKDKCHFWNNIIPHLTHGSIFGKQSTEITYKACPSMDQPLYAMEPLKNFIFSDACRKNMLSELQLISLLSFLLFYIS